MFYVSSSLKNYVQKNYFGRHPGNLKVTPLAGTTSPLGRFFKKKFAGRLQDTSKTLKLPDENMESKVYGSDRILF